MKSVWVVRAGEGAYLIDQFRDGNMVGLGWIKAGDASKWSDQGEYYRELLNVYPDWKARKVSITAGQIYRFANEIEIDDYVLTYDPGQRKYLMGNVIGGYEFTGEDDGFCHRRKVNWIGEVQRDALSARARNSLGAISSLFKLPDDIGNEVLSLLSVVPAQSETVQIENTREDEEFLFEDIQSRALEFVKDQINKLDWDEMQELVAGLLRAMGYKTRVSQAGPDRGKDIIASPDGFGFESPRIVVEVKHRNSAMGSNEIRSFLGGRHRDDKGLYVSTGGFSKDAHYEAERASIPLTLMDLDDLVRAIIEYYEQLDPETRQYIPLKKIYWPA
ncbi:MAG: restriction endonuclease [Gammaproteobacteria bacterium]|nr:restriction endonuclease [Gammaproteobacteria bacterium]